MVASPGVPTVSGERDGPAASALFSSPRSVTLFYNASGGGALTLFVGDTGNHIIRRIRETAPGNGNWTVSVRGANVWVVSLLPCL
jgi:hypothetical protein